MRFAVVGDQGMFGKDMLSLLESSGRGVTGFNRDSIDLDNSEDELARLLSEFDVVINAVAYTAVDKAEAELDLAMKVNGEYAGKLARVAAKTSANFMHISTDYVFDGEQVGPYETSSETNPRSSYGRSKLRGEQLVRDSGATFSIFRTAWLYGKHGKCFPKTIFDKSTRNERIRVVNDQFGQPTWTKDLAQQVLSFSLLEKAPNMVHAVASGETSWFEFAREVVGEYPVEAVSSDEFVTAAKRPRNSVLDNSSTVIDPIGGWRERWRVARSEVIEDV
jgi:dTDP-4-dehydrorhamnose reductase